MGHSYYRLTCDPIMPSTPSPRPRLLPQTSCWSGDIMPALLRPLINKGTASDHDGWLGRPAPPAARKRGISMISATALSLQLFATALSLQLHVCVCVYVCMYFCVYVCMCVCVRAHVDVRMHSCRRILFICTVQSLYYMRVYHRCFFTLACVCVGVLEMGFVSACSWLALVSGVGV